MRWWLGARSKLAVIPQDPFLFSGTVRDNVDPQHLRSDVEVTNAVRQCRLMETISRLGGLDGLIAEGGRMLSAGERQLVCLARAFLSQNQVCCHFCILHFSVISHISSHTLFYAV